MIDSWTILKDRAIKSCHYHKGSVGYNNALYEAAKVFSSLYQADKLVDRKEAEEAFNKDEEVTFALLNHIEV